MARPLKSRLKDLKALRKHHRKEGSAAHHFEALLRSAIDLGHAAFRAGEEAVEGTTDRLAHKLVKDIRRSRAPEPKARARARAKAKAKPRKAAKAAKQGGARFTARPAQAKTRAKPRRARPRPGRAPPHASSAAEPAPGPAPEGGPGMA